MDSFGWPLAALNTLAFVLCVLFAAYTLSVVRPFLRHGDVEIGERDDFDWQLIIPCLNEQTVIVETVDHIAETFPEATVWVVDDGSDDGSATLLPWLQRRYPQVRVVRRRLPDARMGKGAALNAAWRAIDRVLDPSVDRTRVIVGVVDADGRLDPDCPEVIAGPDFFGDDTIDAVQVQVRITEDADALVSMDVERLMGQRARTGNDRLLVRLQDLEFAGPIAAMQLFRARTGSVAMGGNGQFTRLSALDRVAAADGTPWHGALLEDFELGLRVLLTGGGTAYAHSTFVAQSGLTSPRALLRQRTRWSQGNMQCLRYLWSLLNSPTVPLSGAMEIAHFMYIPFSQILGSVVFPLVVLVHLAYAVSDPEGLDAWIYQGAWALIPLGLVFGVGPHALWGLFYRSHCSLLITRRTAAAMALLNVAYGYFLQLAAWRALFRLLRKRNGWAKTARPHDGASPPIGTGALPRHALAGSASDADPEPELVTTRSETT